MTRAVVVLLLALLAVVPVVRAEPVLAVRTGLSCASCHVNRTGGGGRTAYGAAYGRGTLPWRTLPGAATFDGALGDALRVSGDLRAAYGASLPDEGRYLGEYRTEAHLSLALDLLPERLTVYLDERLAPGGAAAREAFGLVCGPRAGLYLKAGRFYLPYGLRLQDDDAATRRPLGFSFDAADQGVEGGAGAGPWSGSLAVTDGAGGGDEADNGKQVTAAVSGIFRRFRVGASGSDNDLPGAAGRRAWGLHGGMRAGALVFLAEADRTRERAPGGEETDGRASHLEADWEAVRGLTFRVWAGRFDPDVRAGGDTMRQAGVGIDWAVLPGLRVRLLYRGRAGPAAATGAGDDEGRAEFHLYF